MFIRKLDLTTFEPSYGVTCKRILPSPESGNTPFNAYWSHIEPGGASQLHRHHEGEVFIIVEGHGVMTVGDESEEVEKGDVIFMKPLIDHTLENSSKEDSLLFMNVYWEDIELLLAADEDGAGAEKPVRTIAYPSPPNPNGDLHLGHLAGPVLSADMYVRHRRMLGDPAWFVIGTDDNQIWTESMARRRGTTPQETADHFAEKILETLGKAGVEVGHYYRPNASEAYHRMVAEMVEKLRAEGHLVAEERPALFCPDCDDLYLFEVRVGGTCPHCQEGTYGNGCENCGLPNDVVDLGDPKCAECGGTPVERPLRRLFFPLEPHREAMEEILRETAMANGHRALCRQMLDAELPVVVASHVSDWGIPVPFEGFEGQCVSAWIEMLPGYLAASAELAAKVGLGEDWRHFWGSEDGRVVQFFGADNRWNHAVLYPVLLKAFDPDAKPPEAFVSNLLYRLDHSKFSTSRNHAVWTRDLVAESSADVVRFYAAYTCPETEQTNFSRDEFVAFVEGELLGRWQPWLASVQAKMDDLYHGAVPEAGAWTDNHLAFLKQLEASLAQSRRAFAAATYSPQRATRLACELVRLGRDFGRGEDDWGRAASAHNERRTGIALELAALRCLALMVAPVMPEFANGLWRALGYDHDLEHWDDVPQFVPSGQVVRGLGGLQFAQPTQREVVAA